MAETSDAVMSTGSSSETESVSGVTIGVDVGGTKIAAGVVDGHGTILRTARRPTHISVA